MAGYLLESSPFNQLKSKINIWGVHAISEQAGTDDPRRDVWVNTAVDASFNTFGTDRYLESLSTFKIRDYAAHVPYDQIIVLVNSDKYGGGGVYNHFSVTTSDHASSKDIFIHEFGHAFGDLGDEYYTSEIA